MDGLANNEPVEIIAPVGGQILDQPVAPIVTPVVPGSPAPNVEPILNEGTIAYDDSKFDKISNELISKTFESTEGLYFDKDGNFVNEKNEIVLDKAKFEANKAVSIETYNTAVNSYVDKLTEFTLEVNGKATECKLDADKNVLDADGNIIMSKEELTTTISENFELEDLVNNDNDDADFVNKLSQLSGYEALDENGEPVIFDSSLEGLAKREAFIVDRHATELANAKLDNFIDQYPDLLDVINYITANGSLENYKPYDNYDNITINTKDDASMMQIIIDAEVESGRDIKEAKELAELFKDNNMLESKAKDKLNYLKSKRQEKINDRARTAQQAEYNRQQEAAAYNSKVNQVVTSGKLGKWNIPEVIKVKQDNGVIKNVSRDAFVDFVTRPVKNGMTMDEIISQKESIDQQLFVSYLRFTGGDLTQLVSNMADSKKVESFKNIKKRIVIGKRNTVNIPNNNKPVSPLQR